MLPFLPFLSLNMGLVSASPAAWDFLQFIRSGHDLAAVPSVLPFALWPLEKKPSKGSTCLGPACVGSSHTTDVHTGASAQVQSRMMTPHPPSQALLFQEGLPSSRSGGWGGE